MKTSIYCIIYRTVSLLANSHGGGSCCIHRPEPGNMFCCRKQKICIMLYFFMSSEFVVICSDHHVWYVVLMISIKHLYIKTLPKAQRTRWLSSYHKLLHKSWSNSIFRISTKHQLQWYISNYYPNITDYLHSQPWQIHFINEWGHCKRGGEQRHFLRNKHIDYQMQIPGLCH